MPGRSSAIGFSQNTGSPDRAARPISSAWAGAAVVITTASTPHRKISSTPGAAVSPSRWASSCARAPSASVRISEPTSR
ncbi:hypothetical protein SFUMM280S_05627 [Streptomyces fumanus]